MSLAKYKGFIGGQKLPAENVNSIDPDNIIAQAAGYLVGGNNPSAVSVFQALGAGNDDGKLKINIDGTVHDNIPVSFILPESAASKKIAQETSNNWSNYAQLANGKWQTFNTGNLCRITQIAVGFYNGSSGLATLSLYDENNNLLGSKQVSIGTMSGGSVNVLTFAFDSEIVVKKNKTYKFVITVQSGSLSISYSSGDPYPDGTNPDYPSADMYFQIYGKNDILTTLSDVATAFQSAIRVITGKTETVIYSTNHFVITSSIKGSTSKILKLMTPSSGTDISGAGVTPYLDMADNATEVAGEGEDYNLVRLRQDGKISGELVDTGIIIIASDNPVSSADTQRYSQSASYEKLKEITIQKSGRYRIYFGLKAGSSGYTSYAKIYKNGVAIGTERTNTTTTFAYYSEDFDLVAGDKIQLYAHAVNTSYTAYVEKFRVMADLTYVSMGSVNVD